MKRLISIKEDCYKRIIKNEVSRATLLIRNLKIPFYCFLREKERKVFLRKIRSTKFYWDTMIEKKEGKKTRAWCLIDSNTIAFNRRFYEESREEYGVPGLSRFVGALRHELCHLMSMYHNERFNFWIKVLGGSRFGDSSRLEYINAIKSYLKKI